MSLFRSDLYRSLALGFAMGAALSIYFASGTLETDLATQAYAAEQTPPAAEFVID